MTVRKTMTPLEKAEWAYNALQIQNVFSRHEYYHKYGQHKEELETIWVKDPKNRNTMSFAGNDGHNVGWDKIYYYYVTMHDEEMWVNGLERYKKENPHLAEDIDANPEKYYGVGEFFMHTLTTPIIEIAEDGQTAKGMWYSPGAVGDNWMWEQYGVDFKNEDGEWKIWHMHMFADFGVKPGESWNRDALPNRPANDQRPPDIPGPLYSAHTKHTLIQITPMPEPYRTFKETFSYGPSAEELMKYLDLTEE